MIAPFDRKTATLRADYRGDLHAWAREQAVLLRAGRIAEADAANIAEELDDVGDEQYDKLESALRVLLVHRLKWDHQPERRARSWVGSIKVHRLDAEDLLDMHPSLKPRVNEAVRDAYRRARIKAAAETGLDEATFPPECPYVPDEIMTRPIPWPSA